MTWQDRARCRGIDPKRFHPVAATVRGVPDYTFPLAVCDLCPVTAECLAENLDTVAGVYGRTTPEERQALRLDALGIEHSLRRYRRGCRCDVCSEANRDSGRRSAAKATLTATPDGLDQRAAG